MVIEVGNVMRVMGLDVGDKTIGIAISDELGLTAQGYPTVIRRSWRSDLDALKVLAAEGRVELVIVGHPLNMDGTEGPRAKIAGSFWSAASASWAFPTDSGMNGSRRLKPSGCCSPPTSPAASAKKSSTCWPLK